VGPLDDPRVMVDDKLLTDALVKAGASQLVNQLKEKATDTLSREVGDKIGTKIGEQGKGVLDGILGGSKREKK
jgi:hypothetical protein